MFYSAGIHIYGELLKAASLWHPKARAMVRGRRQTMQRLSSDGYDVWIHSASLGEFEQAVPLLERIKAKEPDTRVLLSFYSPSGYRVAERRGLDADMVYLPLDTRRRMRAFVAKARPRKAIIVKYEFWPNMLRALREAQVPTYLVSAIFRPDQPFFRRWGKMWRKMLTTYTRIFVQDKASKDLLKGIGVERVTVAGDTRFDRVDAIRRQAKEIPEVEAFKDPSRPLLVFGSSWPQDEALYTPWLAQHPWVKVIIAPHEWDDARLRRLASIPGAVKYSDNPSAETLRKANVLILDTFGLLSSVYWYATAAYIGGGFGAGIHNVNEAAIYGIPVAFGPRHRKFKEASDLLSAGAAIEVIDAPTMAHALDTITADAVKCRHMGRAANAYEQSQIGASDRILSMLNA